jgi:hypothetical protein
MKKSYTLFAALLLTLTSMAQLKIQSGAVFFLNNGATVSVDGDVTSFSDITGSGTLELKGTATQNVNMNGYAISANLQINNPANINLGGSAVVSGAFNLVAGKIQMNAYDLTLNGTISNTFDNTRYFITNGNGRLWRNVGVGAANQFTFPVGADASSYNPVTILENQTADRYGVRCLNKAYNSGNTGDAFVKQVVDAGWVVTDATAGGNFNITGAWSATDELTGFNRSKTGVSKYDAASGTWDMLNSNMGAATSTTIGSTTYYTSTRNSQTIGTFAIGNAPLASPLVIAPKIFLQGAYEGSGLMTDRLRTSGVMPTTEPYSNMAGFTHLGWGGGEKLPSAYLSGTSNPESVVDWVFVQLHRASDSAVIATQSALLKRNGTLAYVDGRDSLVNFINFAGEAAGSYFFTIRHRNHLSVRSANTVAFSKTAQSYDFTTDLAKAFRKSTITTNAPMFQGTDNNFMLWAGNVNGDGYVRVIDQAFPKISSDGAYILGDLLGGNSNGTITGYSIGDVNLDGRVRAIDQAFPKFNSDIAFILGNVLSGISNATRQEHK